MLVKSISNRQRLKKVFTTGRGAFEGTQTELVVSLGADWWDISAGTDRHIATALSLYGPVLHVEPPVSALTRLSNPTIGSLSDRPRLQLVSPHLARLVTYVAAMTWPDIHRLVETMVGAATKAGINRLYGHTGRRDTKELGIAAVSSRRVDIRWDSLSARRKIFSCTDDLSSGAVLWRLKKGRALRAEAAMIRAVDAVAVVSPVLRSRCESLGIAIEVISNVGIRIPEDFNAIDLACTALMKSDIASSPAPAA